MENKQLNITVCLGSSCFSRGNKAIIEAIQDYIEDNNMKDITHLKGGHCFGKCAEGPIMIVNGKTFKKITPESAIFAIESILKSQD